MSRERKKENKQANDYLVHDRNFTDRAASRSLLLEKTLEIWYTMLRRRGSAPAVVLQQHFSESKSVLFRADRIIPPPEVPKLSKAKRGKKDVERGYSPPPMVPSVPLSSDKRMHESQQVLDYDSSSPRCPSPVSPGSPTLSNKKPMKHRPKRRDSEPFVAQTPAALNTRNTTSSALHRRSSSFRDYNIVLLGQGGVGKSGKSSPC